MTVSIQFITADRIAWWPEFEQGIVGSVCLADVNIPEFVEQDRRGIVKTWTEGTDPIPGQVEDCDAV